MKTPRKILLDAAELLRRDGWCQHVLARGKERCLIGALCAAGGSLDLAQSYYLAVETLHQLCDVHIPLFNDQHCKSVDDAIAALEIAADLVTP